MPINLHFVVKGCRIMSSTQPGYMVRPIKNQKHPSPNLHFSSQAWCAGANPGPPPQGSCWHLQSSTGSKKGSTENQHHLVDIVLSGSIYRMMVLEKSGVCPGGLSSAWRRKMEEESLHVQLPSAKPGPIFTDHSLHLDCPLAWGAVDRIHCKGITCSVE